MLEVHAPIRTPASLGAPLWISPARLPANHHFMDLKPAGENARSEILEGLLGERKRIDPKYFYDERGSRLFSALCKTPEYYPTRTETAILERHAREMAGFLGRGCVLIEPGAGESEKVRPLLARTDAVERYVAIDIDGDTLCKSTRALAKAHPEIDVWGVCANFRELERVPGISEISFAPNILFFPGSTIGNMTPREAQAFLHKVRLLLGPAGRVILGVDRRKDPAILEAAYDDAAGITAAFNKNVLLHANALTDADFDPADFEHVALYDTTQHRVEMHLRAKRTHVVGVAGRPILFQAGETIHTENSYKYGIEDVFHLAARAGFEPVHHWSDPHDLFTVYLLQAHLV